MKYKIGERAVRVTDLVRGDCFVIAGNISENRVVKVEACRVVYKSVGNKWDRGGSRSSLGSGSKQFVHLIFRQDDKEILEMVEGRLGAPGDGSKRAGK